MLKRIFVGFIVLFAVNGQRSTVDGSQSEAGLPGAFLRYGVGARELAMGRTGVALADGVDAIYWNPAGLEQASQKRVGFSHNSLLLGAQDNFIGYVHPTKAKGNFAAGLVNRYTGGIEVVDENNIIVDRTSTSETAFILSWANSVYKRLLFGTNFKLVRQDMYNFYDTGTGIDIGFLYKMQLIPLNIGLNFQNLFLLGMDEQWPLNLRCGFAGRLLDGKLRVAFDFSHSFIEGKNLWQGMGFGAEYQPFELLSLRLGRNRTESTFGLGFRWKRFGLDYAFATHELGSTHKFSLNMGFGTAVKKKPPPEKLIIFKKKKPEWEELYEEEKTKRLAIEKELQAIAEQREEFLMLQEQIQAQTEKISQQLGELTAAVEQEEKLSLELLEKTVYFVWKSTTITPKGEKILHRIAEFLKLHPEYKVEIRGHTDSIGDREFNQEISVRRAEKVRDYFVEVKGLSAEKFEAIGCGDSEPIASNDTREGRRLNRRVEILFKK